MPHTSLLNGLTNATPNECSIDGDTLIQIDAVQQVGDFTSDSGLPSDTLNIAANECCSSDDPSLVTQTQTCEIPETGDILRNSGDIDIGQQTDDLMRHSDLSSDLLNNSTIERDASADQVLDTLNESHDDQQVVEWHVLHLRRIVLDQAIFYYI